MLHRRLVLLPPLAALVALLAGADGPNAPPEPGRRPLRVVTLGDSITKGVRKGVLPGETFSALAERALKADGIDAEVVNLGVGSERTDLALKRLDQVFAQEPQVVAVMYGTNDSYVDVGATKTRLSVEEYAANLKAIVTALLLRGIEPILMTEPCWAEGRTVNGLGEDPNIRLAPFMEACRGVAREYRVPLIDHYARWTDARAKGQVIGDWTTDGCHPNPRGHQELAEAMRPALLRAFRPGPPAIPFEVKLDAAIEHDDRKFLWYHPRATPIPGGEGGDVQDVLITLQKHLNASDHYSGLATMRTSDLGKTWAGPEMIPELDWAREPGGVDVAVADVTPMWHPKSGKVIAVGAQVRYSAKGDQLEDRPRSNQTAYAVYDPKSGRWTKWRRLEMPADEMFNFARSACSQFAVEPDGSLLLPFYIGTTADRPYSVTTARCDFDGETLGYREHGNVLKLDVVRGLCEPSLIRSGGRYFLTIRNDLGGYVTSSDDGLHYRPAKAWTFDDGGELGSYNTQQHWLAHGEGLFLVYSRRGANNDHIARHRAPLFIAQVDPDRLCAMRATERILIPERGAELGNFGAAEIGARESWVTVAEGIWDEEARRRGAKGAVYIARVLWGGSAPGAEESAAGRALESGAPAKVVCFGDSVTGVYYHTGSRRAYADMLAIALRRAYPGADVATINAGISGNTTRDALARIDKDVLSHKPALVTVMFGLNDMTRVPLDEYRENLKQIAAKCREAGAEVLFCTPNNVITTPERPTEKLRAYCDAAREVGSGLGIPVCDVYAELDALRDRDPAAWRLLLSDEIHPNMDGHKRIAELLARSISSRAVDLADVPPPAPGLPRVAGRIAGGEPIRVLAMTPFDGSIGLALREIAPGARVEVTPWPAEGKALEELEREARERVRKMAPDLVILVPPRAAKAEPREESIRGLAWLMNHSLNFGAGGWDCVVVHPAAIAPDPDPAGGQDVLIRRLVAAQDLPLIDRAPGDDRPADALFRDWIRGQLSQGGQSP